MLTELASANIIRRTLKLIREEYRAAAAAHLSAPPSAPETPYLGPTTPGLHAPANHYLSNDLTFGSGNNSAAGSAGASAATSPAPSRPALPHTQTSLSNFVAMRHSRAQHQLERTGSVAGFGGMGLGMSGLPTPMPRDREGSLDFNLSASAASFFSGPSRNGSVDGVTSPPVGGPVTPGRGVTLATPGGAPRWDTEEFARQSAKLRPILLQAIEEVIGELETTHEDVARGAKEHIHSS